MFDFVRNRGMFYLLSAIFLVPGIISLVLPGGLNPGIDFTSGTIMTVQFENPVDPNQLRDAILAVAAASICILGYLWWAFNKVSHPVRFGTTAIVALLHDALVVLGIFSILGRLFPAQVELEATFIVAVLTVIGFSVHDT